MEKIFKKKTIKYGIGLTILIIVITNLVKPKETFVINNHNMLSKLTKEEIGVYIDGEVKNKGYIKVPKGTTLEYAINKAEGITKEADIQNIDLKKILKNQEKIIVPAKKDNIEKIEKEYKSILADEELVNINTATIEKLTELEGIGEKTAENIIKYRKEKEFETIEEILEVKGIGQSKFDKIKEKICT